LLDAAESSMLRLFLAPETKDDLTRALSTAGDAGPGLPQFSKFFWEKLRRCAPRLRCAGPRDVRDGRWSDDCRMAARLGSSERRSRQRTVLAARRPSPSPLRRFALASIGLAGS